MVQEAPKSPFTITPQRGLILAGVTGMMSVAYYVTIHIPNMARQQRKTQIQQNHNKLPVHKSMWGNMDQAIKNQKERE